MKGGRIKHRGGGAEPFPIQEFIADKKRLPTEEERQKLLGAGNSADEEPPDKG